MFKNTTIGILLFITHILACITVGVIFRFWKKNKTSSDFKNSSSSKQKSNNFATFSNLGEVLAESITSSISTILLIGGFVVIFSSIISILNASGLLELLSNVIAPVFNGLRY